MPIITIPEHRAKYLLYDNKPCVDDNAEQCKDCLTRRVMSIGDTVGWKQNGDSKHYGKRTGEFQYSMFELNYLVDYIFVLSIAYIQMGPRYITTT